MCSENNDHVCVCYCTSTSPVLLPFTFLSSAHHVPTFTGAFNLMLMKLHATLWPSACWLLLKVSRVERKEAVAISWITSDSSVSSFA